MNRGRGNYNNGYNSNYGFRNNNNNSYSNNYNNNNDYGYVANQNPPARQRNFRGRGRGGNQSVNRDRQGNISNDVRDVRAPVAPSVGPPQGQHLSKTTSDLKNDPLYLEAFCPKPSEDMREISEEIRHYTSFEGMTTVINETYENLCAKSLNFKRAVPLSAYAYYIACMTWARICYLRRGNKYSITGHELDFVEMMYEHGGYVVPKTVGLYLSGVGNLTMPASVESKFDMKKIIYDAEGFFDSMDVNFSCCFYPCIAIFAQRIQYDIYYTNNPNANPEWNPDDMDYDWNTRCIGYAPAVKIEAQAARLYANVGITHANFPHDFEIFRVNVRLLNNIQKYLLEVNTLETVPLPANMTGSVGQCVTNIPAEQPIYSEEIGAIDFESKSLVSVPGSMSYLGSSFLYKVLKDRKISGEEVVDWFFPYTIREPTPIQYERLNIMNLGWSSLLSSLSYHYESTKFKTHLRVKKICSVDLKAASS